MGACRDLMSILPVAKLGRFLNRRFPFCEKRLGAFLGKNWEPDFTHIWSTVH